MVERKKTAKIAFFPHVGYKTVKDVVTRLHVAALKSMRPIVTSSTEGDCVVQVCKWLPNETS